MGDNTHTLAVGANNNSDTGSVHVPADVQREQGICIGTEIEVTIENIEGLFNSVAFENQQISGDRVSIPADIMRATGLEPGEEYPVSFEVVEDDAEGDDGAEQEADDLEDEDFAISDDEDGVDQLLDDLEDGSETEQEAGVEDDEEEEEDKGLGELFG